MRIDNYVSEKRKQQKKRRKYFWSVALFLVLYFIAFGIFAFIVLLPAFQAKQISVIGNSAVSTDEIMNLLQASIIRRGNVIDGPNDGMKALLGFKNLLIWPDVLPTSTVDAIPQLSGITISKNYFSHSIVVTVTERQPFGVWCIMQDAAGLSDSCYWFDNTGDAFARTLDTQGGAIPVVHDSAATDTKLTLGEKVLPAAFMPNFISILNVLKQSGVGVADIMLQDISLQQVDVTTTEGPELYFSLRFPADEDLAVLQSLLNKPGFNKLQYVDFTVQNRAYYK